MTKINIDQLSTLPPESHLLNKKESKKALKTMAKEIGHLLNVMYAQKKHSLLVVFQGMDASGKDGSTKNVFGKARPTDLDAHSFRKPTEIEFAHDFLWRAHKIAPAKGTTSVFIRSHYEDILIQRVHQWIDEEQVTNRMNAINAFEKNLILDNGTTILKFFLHISPDRQKEKLQERIDLPEKNWKHNDGDWEERKYWDQYMKAYEDILNWSEIPWHVVPVDKKWYRNYHVAKIVLETLRNLDLELPKLSENEKSKG